MNRTVIIQASSRSDGDTAEVVKYLTSISGYDIIDLNTKNIGHYDYEYRNKDDDFIPLMTYIIDNYDTIVFATPVYWYTMSGILKVFFDRISDLLRTHKDTGRRLRGKNMAMISASNHDDLKSGFSMPFEESANYLGMQYLGDVHTYIEDGVINSDVQLRLQNFNKTISKQSI
ncbi:flavodoxin family protein [uncultured Algibacter sp.]|uniref:flavodoxin family protein n=1 Tax=uncultured Algibacter sp. TaxID=298659 RepID=UPI0026272971|nr:NAD(P)H-dependent oxidoreductase [uncultured Algibacter sp.]